MEPQTFGRFLQSLAAIQAHLLFGGLIVLLSIGLVMGNAPDDAPLALVFCVVAYPLVLALLWWQRKDAIITVSRDEIERESQPAAFRQKRKIYRMVALVFLLAVSIVLVIAGFRGWLLNGIPAQFIGYAMLVFTGAGVAGVNIWYGGPLDLRNDPEPVTIEDELT